MKNTYIGIDKNEKIKGHEHPIQSSIYEFVNIFKSIGYSLYNGPEIDTEFRIFDALRVAKNHPARDAQDTFWMPEEYIQNDEKILPRTHTSNAQILCMNEKMPSIKIISAGKVFRNEAIDATHEAEFHQIEGVCINTEITMSDLKNTLTYVFRNYFNDENLQIRFRASYFPFVKPGVEVDIYWKNKWLEVCGAGLIHEEVLKNGFKDNANMGQEDYKKYNGFAFGMGLERLVMLKYGIDDIRDITSEDIHFSKWF